MPEFYRQKYGSNTVVKCHNLINWDSIMLIYQPIKVPESVFYLCNTLKAGVDESHMMNQSQSQAAFKY